MEEVNHTDLTEEEPTSPTQRADVVVVVLTSEREDLPEDEVGVTADP